MWVHSSVVRAADCRSAGPWFKSGCALLDCKQLWHLVNRHSAEKSVAAKLILAPQAGLVHSNWLSLTVTRQAAQAGNFAISQFRNFAIAQFRSLAISRIHNVSFPLP